MKDRSWAIGLSALAFLVLVGVILYGLGAALKPLLLAMLLAYLSFPLILKIERRGVPRVYAVVGVFAAFVLALVVALVLLVPPLIEQGQSFVRDLPQTSETAINRVEDLARHWGVPMDLSRQGIKDLLVENVAVLSEGVAKATTQSVQRVFSNLSRWFAAIVGLILFPLIFFYLIHDYERIAKEIQSFIPKAFQPTLNRYLKMSNRILSGYVRGQLLVAGILSLLYGIGLWLVGLPFGFLIGVISGLLSIVPYAGFTIGFAIALVTLFANFTGIALLIGVIAVFAIVQTLESLFITPRLVGSQVGISPLVGLLAIVVGGNLFGFLGVLLAIPAAAILKSIIYDLRDQYLA